MIAALLMMAAEPITAIDAERAFAADAQRLGQWTAFGKYAADDAVMFVPQQVNAQAFLKPLKDPPAAVFWWPGKSFVSCDGSYAVNTGPWVRQWGKAVGYFTTVWKRQPDGSWKWIYDGGDTLPTLRAEGGDIHAETASCEGKPPEPITFATDLSTGQTAESGRSKDGTLVWSWMSHSNGYRQFMTQFWDGQRFQNVINDMTAPSK